MFKSTKDKVSPKNQSTAQTIESDRLYSITRRLQSRISELESKCSNLQRDVWRIERANNRAKSASMEVDAEKIIEQGLGQKYAEYPSTDGMPEHLAGRYAWR